MIRVIDRTGWYWAKFRGYWLEVVHVYPKGGEFRCSRVGSSLEWGIEEFEFGDRIEEKAP